MEKHNIIVQTTLELVNTVAIAHGLDPKKATDIKSWDKTFAVHFR